MIARMRFKDYFAGQDFRLHSPLPPFDVAACINREAGSALWPFSFGVIGGMRFGHIRLQYRNTPFDYNAKPVLSGRVCQAQEGSTLYLRYRAPGWVFFLYPFYYLFLLLMTVMMIAGAWGPGVTGSVKAIAALAFFGFLVGPLVLHALGTRRSGEELSQLLDFLFRHVDATDRPPPVAVVPTVSVPSTRRD